MLKGLDPLLPPDLLHALAAMGHGDKRRHRSELEGREVGTGSLERFAFYERSRGAFATVITGEDAPYACFLLIKGVIA